MRRLLGSINLDLSIEDDAYLEKLKDENDSNKSEELRKIIDDFLELPSPPISFSMDKKLIKSNSYMIGSDQVDQLNKLCKKFGGCARVGLIRTAIYLHRRRGEIL